MNYVYVAFASRGYGTREMIGVFTTEAQADSAGSRYQDHYSDGSCRMPFIDVERVELDELIEDI